MRELGTADGSTKFFSAEWKNVARNWANYLVDLEKMVEEEEDLSVLAELQVLEKQVNAAKTVLQKISMLGLTHPDSLACYRSQVTYLSMEPAAPSPFPPFLARMMHQHLVEDTWPAEAFWSRLSDAALAEFLDEAEVPGFQMTVLSSKVMMLCEQKLESVGPALNELCTGFLGKCGAAHSPIKAIEVKENIQALEVIVRHGLDDGKQKDLATLSSTLERLIGFKVWDALQAYPHGRSIIERAKGSRSLLQSQHDRNAVLMSLLQEPVLSAEQIERLDGLCRSMSESSTSDPGSLVSQEFVKDLLQGTLRSFVAAYFVDKKPEMQKSFKERVAALSKTDAVHSIHDAVACYIDVYKSMQEAAIFINDFEAMDREKIDQQIGTRVLFTLNKFDEHCDLHKRLFEACGDSAKDVLAWWAHASASQKASQCLVASKQQASVVEASAKQAVTQFFKSSVAVDAKPATLERLAAFLLEGDVPSALQIMRSLPAHGLAALEIQFVTLFGNMVKSYAAFRLLLDGMEKKSDRKLTAAFAKSISGIRSDMKVFEDFWKQPSVQAERLFSAGPDIKEKLAQSERARLGIAFDLSQLDQTVAEIKAFVKQTVDAWSKDASDLAVLVSGWSIGGWELAKDSLLEEKNKELVQRMLSNTNYSRCGKGSALLREWRQLLKGVSTDGCGVVIAVEDMKSWGLVVRSAAEYCEVTHALHQVTTTIPSVRNLNMRKAAAKSFLKDIKDKVDVGASILDRATHLANHDRLLGATVKEQENADQPEAKRAKTESGEA